jgi:hypothetical protein
MGMNFSRIFGGLFGKKEMRAYSNCRFAMSLSTFSILTRFLGILMVTLTF